VDVDVDVDHAGNDADMTLRPHPKSGEFGTASPHRLGAVASM